MHVPVRGRRSIAPLLLALMLAATPAVAQAQSQAEMLLWRGEVDAALRAAAEAAGKRPDDLDAHELLIDIYLSGGYADRAAEQYGERVRQDPTSPDAHYLHGRALVDAGQARDAYEKALRFDPDHARSHMGVAAVHLAQGRLGDARAAYGRAVQLDPSLGEAWLGLVRGAIAAEDLAAARKATADGLQAVPTEGGLYLARVALEPQTALATLEQAIRNAPKDPRLHEALATARLEAGDAAGAVKSATRALASNPRLPEAARTQLVAKAVAAGSLDMPGYQSLAQARQLQEQDAKAAAAAFDDLVKRYPATALTWMARAQLRQAAGDRDGALSDLKAALEREPDNVEVQAAYGLLLLEAERGEEARTLLRNASGARPWDPSLRLALGRAHRAAGDPAAAVLELMPLRKRMPHDVDVVLHLAQAHVESGNAELAYVVVRDALRTLPDPRIGAAMILAATAAGRFGEAASLLEQVAQQTGDARLRDAAAQLRERARAEGG